MREAEVKNPELKLRSQMSFRTRLFISLVLALGLLVVLLIWRVVREGDFTPSSPLAYAPARPTTSVSSPLSQPTATPFHSPLRVPPTGTPPVNTATLEAIRANRPTTTSPSPSGIHLPHIPPATWRRWALWIFAAAAVLAYIGLRLRKGQ